jgi:hypothetical protein
MFPMRLSTIFKNRWWALIWATGIIWFAYDFGGSQLQSDNETANAEQANSALNAF